MNCLAIARVSIKGSIVEATQRVIEVKDLIDQTLQSMLNIGYSEKYLKQFKYSYKLFLEYSLKNSCQYYSEKLALAFLEEYCNIFSNKDVQKNTYQKRKNAISKLDEMHKYNNISSRKQFARKKYQFYGALQSSIEKYVIFKATVVSEARIRSIKLYLERFSLFVSKIDTIKQVTDLKNEHIIKFIESCSIYSDYTIYATVTSVRQYIAYLEKNEYIQEKLSTKIPKIAKKREKSYPSAFTKDETEALLNSIKRVNSKERRDYAMLLLAARIGLRASDIANLEFRNIDWDRNQINIVQQKTKTALTLPLLNDVGEAIIDYIKNGRPKVDEPHIFIRENKPYIRINGSSLHMIVDGYLKRANIKVPTGKKHGPHALRHSIATLLLENNIPISTIKEILAHKSSETTKVYLKVAQKQLLECALDIGFLAGKGDELCIQ
jgi:site-specific recombinase XerD